MFLGKILCSTVKLTLLMQDVKSSIIITVGTRASKKHVLSRESRTKGKRWCGNTTHY